jgi:RecA-family ATPase
MLNGRDHEPQVPVTFFSDYAAVSKDEGSYTFEALADCIRTATATEKKRLPWLKLARFGDIRTDKNSLRHDGNVLALGGLEADYDRELMPLDEAVEILTKAGVQAIIYTTPSHSDAKPRWRVLCPFSSEYPPDNRDRFMGRLNGLFRGMFSGESWTLSQSYYFGSVQSNPAHQVELIDGTPIDEMDELDEIWIGKPKTETRQGTDGKPRTGPMDEAALLAEITNGSSYHAAAVRLLGRWAVREVPLMDARAKLIAAFEGVFPPDRDARWKARRADVDRCLEDIYGKEAKARDEGRRDSSAKPGEPSSQPAPASFAPIDPTTLFGQPVPEREWIVQDWLPVGAVTANYSDGGTGKTLLAQQLMTSAATLTLWCGRAVMQCKSLALFCEDDADELHRRQDQINGGAGRNFSDLGNMRWVSGVGQDNTLVSFNADGQMLITARYLALRQAILDFGARLVILDTAADLFAGNENDRHQVRQFISLLSGLAVEIQGAVLLNAHPSRAGLTTGNLDGGSTAWNNSVRSRWSLARPAGDGDTQPDINERVLTRRKANYATIGDTIALRWVNGILAPVTQESSLTGSILRQRAEQVFLTLLDRCSDQGVFVSHSTNAGNYAAKVFSRRPDRDGYNRKDFENAMHRLFQMKAIRVEDYVGPSRNHVQRIVRQTTPVE